jgi:hypothetical protein
LVIITAYDGGMATAVAAPAPSKTRSVSRTLRLGLAVLAFLALPMAVLFGERSASMDAFDSDVASGDVPTVHLVGAFPPGALGATTVRLHWRTGLIAYVSQIYQVTDPGLQSQGVQTKDRVVVGDFAAQLTAAHPGLHVVSDPGPAYVSGLSGDLLGWQVPGWLAFEPLIVGLGTLALLINGPEPWRATRWAWFWFIANPVGVAGIIAFLLLSGPTPLIPSPRVGGRRLHGGWAFIIATVAAGIWRQHSPGT